MRRGLPRRVAAQLHQPDGDEHHVPGPDARRRSRSLGLCHSVYWTVDDLCELIGVPDRGGDLLVGRRQPPGLAAALGARRAQDLYPLLDDRDRRRPRAAPPGARRHVPPARATTRPRPASTQPSTSPWYLRAPRARSSGCGSSRASTSASARTTSPSTSARGAQLAAGEPIDLERPSAREYAPQVIHSLVTGTPRTHLRQRRQPRADHQPARGAGVEVPVRRRRAGRRPDAGRGTCPPQCAALNRALPRRRRPHRRAPPSTATRGWCARRRWSTRTPRPPCHARPDLGAVRRAGRGARRPASRRALRRPHYTTEPRTTIGDDTRRTTMRPRPVPRSTARRWPRRRRTRACLLAARGESPHRRGQRPAARPSTRRRRHAHLVDRPGRQRRDPTSSSSSRSSRTSTPTSRSRSRPGAPTTDDLLQKLSASFAGGTYPDISYAFGSWAGRAGEAPAARSTSPSQVADPDVELGRVLRGGARHRRPTGRQDDRVPGRRRQPRAHLQQDALRRGRPRRTRRADWTWDDFRDCRQGADRPATSIYGTAYSVSGGEDTTWQFWPQLWQNGGEILTDDDTEAAFDSEAGVDALELLRDDGRRRQERLPRPDRREVRAALRARTASA